MTNPRRLPFAHTRYNPADKLSLAYRLTQRHAAGMQPPPQHTARMVMAMQTLRKATCLCRMSNEAISQKSNFQINTLISSFLGGALHLLLRETADVAKLLHQSRWQGKGSLQTCFWTGFPMVVSAFGCIYFLYRMSF